MAAVNVATSVVTDFASDAPAVWVVLLVVLALVVDFLDFVVLAVFIAGALTTFRACGVGLVVHCHLPFAKTHAWPSLAVPYASLRSNTLPTGSTNPTWLPLLDKASPVSAEKKARKACGSINVPSGKV